MISVKRDRLLAAGQAIAEKKPSLSALSPEAIVAAARLEQAHFDAEFASMDDYLVELQRRFLESTLSAVVAELGAAPAGLGWRRLLAATGTPSTSTATCPTTSPET